jgi:LAS seventeen-binding protein 5
VTIERLTSESFEEDDLSGIPDLVEVIKLQSTGPTEAARAIRKKLKYGNVHRQLRALTILDGLIQNAGPRFQRAFADEPLLERLRVCGTSYLSEPEVREKCSELFRQWAAEYRGKPGMERIASLYKELPRRKQVVTQERSKVLKETENPFGDDEEEEAKEAQQAPPVASSSQTSTNLGTRPTGRIESFSTVASSSSKEKKNKKASKDAKGRGKKFNLEAEKGQMTLTIAESSIASTNLMNALQSVNREKERISENPTVLERFETAKNLRRRILRYVRLTTVKTPLRERA